MNKINPKYKSNMNRDIYQRGARQKLKWINNNLDALQKVRNGDKYIKTATNLSESLEVFTPQQLSYVDVLYEKVMKGLGEESFTATYKPRRKY